MIFGLIIAYDPLGKTQIIILSANKITSRPTEKGSQKYRRLKDGNDNIDPTVQLETMHQKVTKLWLRRFKLAFCCVAKDEFGDEAFTQSAELFSHLFRGTDLVPSGQ